MSQIHLCLYFYLGLVLLILSHQTFCQNCWKGFGSFSQETK